MGSIAPAMSGFWNVLRPDGQVLRGASSIAFIRAVELPRLGVGAWLFCLSVTVYLMLAVIFVLQQHLIVGDAWSRVGNAYYVVASRDPHLAAIGFVWNPLPSLLEIPLVMLRPLWPPLVSQGFAGSILSALAMGGAVYQLYGILSDWSVPRLPRVGLTLLFATNPMVLHYGFNGDTEGLYLFLLFVSVRYLSRWVTTDSVGALVVAGVAVALSYWTRYESAVVGVAVMGVAFGVAFRRAHGNRSHRLMSGVADAAIVGLPFFVAFVAWTLASWIIVGSPFEQFSSEYGTSSQLATGRVLDGVGVGPLPLVALVLAGFAPGLVLYGPGSLIVALTRRDIRWIAPVTVLGAVLAFAVGAWLLGKTGGWIRYYITIIPLAVLLGGFMLQARRAQAEEGHPRRVTRLARGSFSGLMVAFVIAGLLIAIPTTWLTMVDRTLGRGESNKTDDRPQYLLGAAVSDYLDEMNLRRGAVLVDVFLGFPIVLQSDNPAQFVITPDRDFIPAVTDPEAFKVQYMLVPPSGGLGNLDALKRQWPGLYQNGAGVGELVHEFDLPGLSDGFKWRLYRVTS
jgi:hypothetical protein